jgi:hypothetical protein
MDIETQIKRILKSYKTIDGNLINCQKIFVANSVLIWALENVKEKEKIIYYIREVEKHLKDEITLYWEDGSIKVKRKRK